MTTQIFATVCFAAAIAHTFSVGRLRQVAKVLGEVELVFILWASVYMAYLFAHDGVDGGVRYLTSLNFHEPLFVFVVMSVSATRPVMHFAERLIEAIAKILPLPPVTAFYAVALTVGPLLGSFITEPAAMTVTALILRRRYYAQNLSPRLMYATLALLFVNVSIGGTLTAFAAPPVLMVREAWGWNQTFMLRHFAYKAVLATALSTSVVLLMFRRELLSLNWKREPARSRRLPYWVTAVHLGTLAFIIIFSHTVTMFLWGFAFFLLLAHYTYEHHLRLRLHEAGLVALFLGGLVILGPPQCWWLAPAIAKLDPLPLYLGSTGLTAILDNAALTYLGTQVPSLSEASRYALVAGAVVGGGLSVIANAPNPAGYALLNEAFRKKFGREGISPRRLLISALGPTLVSALCFWFL